MASLNGDGTLRRWSPRPASRWFLRPDTGLRGSRHTSIVGLDHRVWEAARGRRACDRPRRWRGDDPTWTCSLLRSHVLTVIMTWKWNTRHICHGPEEEHEATCTGEIRVTVRKNTTIMIHNLTDGGGNRYDVQFALYTFIFQYIQILFKIKCWTFVARYVTD